MNDDKRIELFWTRDEKAILVTRAIYGVRLRQFAMHILKNSEDAEESENDTYLKVWNSIPPQKPKYLYAYLSKICRNIVLDKLDWKNAQKRKVEIVELTNEIEFCIPNFRYRLEQQNEEIGQLIRGFLGSLEEESRLFFMRRYYFMESVKDIAQRYNVSESKVKTSLFRSRKKLRVYLEGEGVFI